MWPTVYIVAEKNSYKMQARVVGHVLSDLIGQILEKIPSTVYIADDVNALAVRHFGRRCWANFTGSKSFENGSKHLWILTQRPGSRVSVDVQNLHA